MKKTRSFFIVYQWFLLHAPSHHKFICILHPTFIPPSFISIIHTLSGIQQMQSKCSEQQITRTNQYLHSFQTLQQTNNWDSIFNNPKEGCSEALCQAYLTIYLQHSNLSVNVWWRICEDSSYPGIQEYISQKQNFDWRWSDRRPLEHVYCRQPQFWWLTHTQRSVITQLSIRVGLPAYY